MRQFPLCFAKEFTLGVVFWHSLASASNIMHENFAVEALVIDLN